MDINDNIILNLLSKKRKPQHHEIQSRRPENITLGTYCQKVGCSVIYISLSGYVYKTSLYVTHTIIFAKIYLSAAFCKLCIHHTVLKLQARMYM